MQPVLTLRKITKDYPGVRALNGVDLDVFPSEVHALVGENGAGKSTLLKILSGAIRHDGGDITVNETSVPELDPLISQRLGISIIYQEFNLVPYLSIARNIFLGHESQIGSQWVLNKAKMNKRAGELLVSLGVDIDPKLAIAKLSVSEKQMVEIARALSLKCNILLMDEPSASLAEHEVDLLFRTIQKLKENRVAIVYVSHRLEEIFKIADRVSVLRDGVLITTRPISEITMDEVIRYMVGREIKEHYPKESFPAGDLILEVRGVGGRRVESLKVHAGEVVGIAGLVGSGKTELGRVIFGADHPQGQQVFLDGKKIHPRSPREAIQLGIGMVPEDRKEQGLIIRMAIRENITLPILDTLTRWNRRIDRGRQKEIAVSLGNKLKIQTPSIFQISQNLSGGNQQKVVLAKWLATKSRVLILDEPTRGIDVGAKTDMYRIMNNMVKEGKGIIFISPDLPEVIAMSDRIYVMRSGRLVGEFIGGSCTQEQIMRCWTEGDNRANS
jgi:ribose transport system ATP-binding protein